MVYANVLQSVRAVLEGMFKLDLPLGSEKARKMANVINDIVLSNREAAPIPDDIYDGIKVLLADKGFQAAIQRRGSFYLPDSALYFIENVDRICDAQYIPTQQDILLLRVATLGVIEVKFMIKNKIWRVFDVGGQRSQRKKWIHCFDDVTSVSSEN
uniref:Uncharacterized protein n=1 Tax=Panagrolaimus superbus TaxID=310955 RepID=A0A914ZH55_9BILA